ncbi:hypothetical protein DACRYDRAFT_118390 [Dacryopinax primogenitus]|uniref:BTB domain-containing protein n=1 Tax=Dacryopinax primogenitus (strain DJM 731) TaxID=1858805 RepID=M5G5U2_DACPD|nr:uncharacterized protein DACRYDRAFT_118390 [Dacryopinax primogenitus]EJT99127.1 hypothetical protein DACRYDRAFT_118390 [Dacryopinax primogenitus]
MQPHIPLSLDIMEDAGRYMSGSALTLRTNANANGNANGASLPPEHIRAQRVFGSALQVDEQFAGDTIILVENTLFHIPTYLLHQSTLFAQLFDLRYPGSSTSLSVSLSRALEESPVDMNVPEPSLTARSFRAFAKALLSPAYAPTSLSPEELLPALEWSSKWCFPSLTSHLLSQLALSRDPSNAPSLLPHARFPLAKQYSSQRVLDQALVDQCLSLSPPDMLAYDSLIQSFGPAAFLDLIETRRLVWSHLRALASGTRGENTVWTDCAHKPDWCHTAPLFRQALADVLLAEGKQRTRNAPYEDFDAAFCTALDSLATGSRACETCRGKTVERMSWFIDSTRIFDIVRERIGPLLSPPASQTADSPVAGSHLLTNSSSPETGKRKTPSTAGQTGIYLWNAAWGLPVEGSAQQRDWERLMDLQGETMQSVSGSG